MELNFQQISARYQVRRPAGKDLPEQKGPPKARPLFE